MRALVPTDVGSDIQADPTQQTQAQTQAQTPKPALPAVPPTPATPAPLGDPTAPVPDQPPAGGVQSLPMLPATPIGDPAPWSGPSPFSPALPTPVTPPAPIGDAAPQGGDQQLASSPMPTAPALPSPATNYAPATTPTVQAPTNGAAPQTPTVQSLASLLGSLPSGGQGSNMGPYTPSLTDPYGTGGIKNAQGQYVPAGVGQANGGVTNAGASTVNDAAPGPPPSTLAGPSTPSTPGTPSLPAGYTTGSGADAGSIYYNGQKIEGVDPQTGQAILPGGARGAKIDDYLSANQNAITQQQATARDANQLALAQNSPDQAIRTLFNDPAYLAARQAAGSSDVHINTDTGQMTNATGADVGSGANAANEIANIFSSAKAYTPPSTQGPANYLVNGLNVDANGTRVAGGYNALTDLYRQLGVTPGVVNDQVRQLVTQNPALIDTLPPDQAATLRAGLSGSPSSAGSGGASGTPANTGGTSIAPGILQQIQSGGGNTDGGGQGAPGSTLRPISPNGPANTSPIPGNPPTASASSSGSSGASSSGGSSGSSSGGSSNAPISTGNPTLDALLNNKTSANASLTPTDPNNPLTNNTIGVSGTTDPVAQALAAYNTFRQSTDPQYQADLRDATRMAAATGTIGSGQLNTSLGNIANTRQNTLATQEQNLLNNALTTQNENAYKNVGIAQQQQGFQNQQQQEAFNNALEQAMYGSQGDPSQLGLALSAIFGNQANAAGSNLGSLIGGSAANSSTQNLLQQILGAYGGRTGTGTSSPSTVDPATQQILDSILNSGIPGLSTIGSL